MTLDFADVAGAPTPATLRAVERAFGPGGLGLIAITGVPDFARLRAAALPLAFAFATQPPATLARYEHAASHYSFGWSRGREKFGGVLDTAKGSFYFNPLHDAPCAGSAAARDPALAPFYHPNVWPAPADAPPDFEAALKALGAAMVRAGVALAAHVDAFVAERAAALGRGAVARRLRDVVAESRTPKARLLFYYPVDGGGGGSGGSGAAAWCGAHNDHGSLTALTPAIYFDTAGAVVPCPDADAGLYVYSRAGAPVRVALPPGAVAMQIGETAQVQSGGILRATPHLVRAPSTPGVARAALAVFMEPEHGEAVDVPPGAAPADALAGDAALPPGVPPLAARWRAGATFEEFTIATLKAYY